MFKKFVNLIREVRLSHENAKLNRKIVGSDRNSNKYYQYYDNDGNETKRVCEYTNRISEHDIDPIWDAWLRKRTRVPPTSDNLKDFYEAEDNWKENALNYEKKDSDMMREYRKEQQKKAGADKKSTQSEGFGKNFEPGKWRPVSINKKDSDKSN